MWSKWPCVTRIAAQREPWDASCEPNLRRGAARVDDDAPRERPVRRERGSSSSRAGRAAAGRPRRARRESTDAPRFRCAPRRDTVAPCRAWDMTTIDAPGGTVDPAVLTTDDGARAIAIRLEAGQAMNDHQVRERAWVVVVEGRAEIRCGDQVVDGGVGDARDVRAGRAPRRVERERRPSASHPRAVARPRPLPRGRVALAKPRPRRSPARGRSASGRLAPSARRFSCDRHTSRSMK